MALTGKNISLPIYHDVDGNRTPFHDLVLRKFTVDSVVMSLGDKITGDVYYKDSNLECSMQEYVIFNDIEYTLVNPPTLVKEGLVKDNSDLKGMSKYSFEFYHPMYILGNLPFTDVAVSYDEIRYKSQDKTFSWIGKPADFVAKLNKNLDHTEWVVVLSDKFPQEKLNELSGVIPFDNNTIADALKTAYDTWGVPFVVDKLGKGECFDNDNNDYYSQAGGGKRYLITVGLSSNEILDGESEYGTIVRTTTAIDNISDVYYSPSASLIVPKGKKIILQSLTSGVTPIILNSEHNGVIGTSNRIFDEDTTIYIGSYNGTGHIRYFFEGELGNIFVFKFGQGVGLKNNSRTPRNNKIVTRIAGYGSENNIPYGYPQIRWYGDPNAKFTYGDRVGVHENVTINGEFYEKVVSYPIYEGIVGGEWVKLIKHPFTRSHLMPSVYYDTVFNKVSFYYPPGVFNQDYDPDIEIKDYYDAVDNDDYPYVNLINPIAPSYEIHGFDGIKPELGEAYILDATPINSDLTEASDWDDTMDDNGNYLQSYFKITLPQLSFDIYACAAITQEMQINMRSGACIGCTFTVQVDWEDYKRNFYDSDMNFAPHGTQRNYERYPDSSNGSITVVVQKDTNTFGTLMPNIYQNPHAGDAFVVLGISLPLSYIISAQKRLDDAMKSYMLENNVYYFDYPLKFDEYMLANRTDILNQIRPNSIIRFEFNDEELELFVKQLTIKFNDGVLPQYDITLTDNVEIVLNKIGQVADDVEHLGTLISLLRQQYGKNVLVELGKKLSKVDDDVAQGLISFMQGWETYGFFSNNFLGYGAKVDHRGVGEFEEINVRGALRAAELVFNQIRAEGGEKIESIGYGEILTVDKENRKATLKLDGDEWATIDAGDICRGLYNTIGKGYTTDDEGEDANGFRTKAGFFASYFTITSVTKNAKGECEFTYDLQPGTTEHPCPLMKFAVYGNFDDTKKERQSSIYTTAVGIAPRQLYLARVNDWQIKPQNIKIAKGNIDGLQVYEKDADGNPVLKTLYGDAGFFVEDNIYFGGILNQFSAADWDYIQSKLGQGIHAQLLRGSDNIVVDALGNVVGGIYEEFGDGTTVNKRYKLHTGVIVYDSGKEQYLKASEAATLADDEYRIYHVCDGCTVLRDGSDFYITGIDNTNDGLSGTVLTDDQLDIMRDTEGCSINFIIVTANGWRTQISYHVKITHLDYSYVTFDLTNEMDSITYRTQTKRYEVLPVESEMKAYVNGQEASIISTTVKTNFVTADASESTITVEGTNAVKEYFFRGAAVNGMKAIIQKSGKVRIEALNGEHVDFDDSRYYFYIACVVKYAGVRYESTVKRFTLTEVTDATLYKLLLSANAISKDQGIYTPSTIDVKVQIIDSTGTSVNTAAWMNANSAVKVRYVNGPYEATSNLLDTMPAFADVPTCITVVLIDTATNTILDVESVPMTAVGRDGAGQPWVKTNFDSFVIDCDWQGNVLADKTINVTAQLYWGSNQCALDASGCDIYIYNSDDSIVAPDGYSGNPETSAYRSFTFQRGDHLDSTYIYISLTSSDNEYNASKTIPVIANVHGQKGEKGDAGASVRFLGDWKDGEYYVWNATFRDCVKHDGVYWLVNVASNGTVLLGEPTESNTNWGNIGAMRFIATELLMAERGTINLLASNVLNMYNGAYKTASLNSDSAGAYIVYYPSGKKMMQMASDGYWRYFNDDDGNTERWKLGFGGAIEMNNADSWPEVYLAPSSLDVEFNRNDTFTLNEYHTFKSGSSGQWRQWNGYYFDSVPTNTNPATPQGANYLNGVYIASGVVLEELGESVNDNRLYVELLHINNGELQQRIIRYKNNDGTYTNVITSGQI